MAYLTKSDPLRNSACRFPSIPFVLYPKRDASEIRNEPFSLSMGDCRRWWTFGLRRYWRDVFIAGFASTNHAGYRLVRHRRIQRHDDRVPCDGVHKHGL